MRPILLPVDGPRTSDDDVAPPLSSITLPTGRRSQVRPDAAMDRSPATRATLVALVLCALACLGVVLAPAGPVHAAATVCVAAPDTGCVNGTIRTQAGEPAVGVNLTIDGPGGEITATTGPDGRWSAAVQQPGEYTVTVDESTLPAGET